MTKERPSAVRAAEIGYAVIAVGVLLGLALLIMMLVPPIKGGLDFRRVAGASEPAPAVEYRETRWYELGPKGWDPFQELRDLQREARAIPDSDARAVALLKKSRELWDNAPTNPGLEGAEIRIPGYVVPLDPANGTAKDFLLVPYFGACIHTPPPPSNQIIHVTMKRAISGIHSMDTFWVSGTLRAGRIDSSMGVSGYTLQADRADRYTPSPAQ